MIRNNRVSKKSIYIVAIVGVLLIAGVVCTVIKGKFYKTDKDSGKDMIQVCMLTKNVEANDILDEDAYSVVELPSEQAPDDLYVQNDGGTTQRFKIQLPKGVILTKSMTFGGEPVEDDLRLHNFPYIELTDKIQTGEYVDIRISFPNGADYIVLSKKNVVDYSLYDEEEGTDNSLWLEINEEEIMRISSAVVDASMSEGCKIYAIKYVNGMQKEAVPNYPVSASIQALIDNDPNLVEKAQEKMKESVRKELESQIEKSEDKTEGSQKKEDDKQNNNSSDNTNNNNPDNYTDSENTSQDSQVYERPDEEKIEFFD